MAVLSPVEQVEFDFDRVARQNASRGYGNFLSCYTVNSYPRKLWPVIAEKWQKDREKRRAPALDDLAGISPGYSGPRWFWEGCAKGNDKSTGVGRRITFLLAFAKTPLQIYICSGKEEQAAIITSAMKMEIEANPWLQSLVSIGDYSGTGASGSELHVLPMKAATGQGIFPDYLIADELTHWQHEEGKQFWDFVVASVGKRSTRCVFEVCTNAGFKGSWQWNVRNAYMNSPLWSFYEQPAHTQLAKWLDDAKINELSQGMSPGEKRRLHGNEWIDPGEECGILTLAQAEACIDPTLEERIEGDPKIRYYASIDYGQLHDRTAMCVMHNIAGTDEVIIDRLDVWQGRPGNEILIDIPEDWEGKAEGKPAPRSVEGWCELTRKNFRILAFVFDKWQMISLFQKYTRRNVRVELFDYMAGKKNMAMGKLLQSMVQNRKLTWSKDAGYLEGAEDDTLPKELARLVRKEMTYGWRFDHEASGHDDRATAIGMGLLWCVPETRPAGQLGPTAVLREEKDEVKEPNTPPPVPMPKQDWARGKWNIMGMGRG